jgi:protein-tyrosine phosphatase
MPGFVDLHCHWIPKVDDGASSIDEARDLLRGLGELGFDLVVGTPHMRPGLFDRSRVELVAAFHAAEVELAREPGLPRLALSAEHYFDDVVFSRLLAGEGVPYPGGRAVLLEFYEIDFPPSVTFRLADLRRRGLLPIVAHPERYPAIGRNPAVLERLLDVGAAALLDIGALADRYGRGPRRTAETLLEQGLYHAACSDAHGSRDVRAVEAGMRRLAKRWGDEELDYLLCEGPRALLAGELLA